MAAFFKSKAPQAQQAAPTTQAAPIDPNLQPWNAPLDGPAPNGYTRQGNQWVYSGTSDQFQTQYPEAAAGLAPPWGASNANPIGSLPPEMQSAPATPSPLEQAFSAPSPGGGGGGGWGGGGGAESAPTAAGGGATRPGIQQAYQDALMKMLNGPSPQEAGMNVMHGPAVTAFNANAKRQEGRDRQMLAERAAANGFSQSGGFESDLLGLRARGSEAMNRYAGEQASVAEQGRRSELLSSMQLALAMGDNEAARAIQRELGLGQIGASNYATSTSRENNLDALGFNYAKLNSDRDAEAMRLLFGG